MGAGSPFRVTERSGISGDGRSALSTDLTPENCTSQGLKWPILYHMYSTPKRETDRHTSPVPSRNEQRRSRSRASEDRTGRRSRPPAAASALGQVASASLEAQAARTWRGAGRKQGAPVAAVWRRGARGEFFWGPSCPGAGGRAHTY